MRERLCAYCQKRPVSKPNRKYCRAHSAQASAILKRQYRKDWKARGDKYWRDDWKTDEARREYFRNYMRRYRRRKRNAPAKSNAKPVRRAA